MSSQAEDFDDEQSFGNAEDHAMQSSGIDDLALQAFLDRLGVVSQIPLLKEASASISQVLLACGDANGFLADNLSDVLASLQAFCAHVASKPANFIIHLANGDISYIQDQIQILQKVVENTSSSD